MNKKFISQDIINEFSDAIGKEIKYMLINLQEYVTQLLTVLNGYYTKIILMTFYLMQF